MPRRWALFATLLAGCGGHAPRPMGPQADDEIRLEPVVAGQQWFRARSTCAQGPFELEVPATGGKWGEDIELRMHTPRRVGLHAVILVDGKETEVQDAVFDAGGTSSAKPENARCIADVKERLVLARTGGGSGGTAGTTAPPGTLVVPPPDRPAVTPQLDLDTSLVTTSTDIVKIHLGERAPGAALPRITIRFWSVDPNDLDGVLFGWAHLEWRPNVPEERYEAHLRWQAEQAQLLQARRDEEQRRSDEEWRRKHLETPRPVIVVDPAIERAARLAVERKREEARRRREISAALEAERRLRRQEFCAAHAKDRDCWGAGGMAMHLELERHRQEREAYCAAHTEDARCWTETDWQVRRAAWQARIDTASAPPKQPEGPPPAALVEEQPPRLSIHADWRPGYWQWTEGTWVWLAGMWRVPDADITSGQTTEAPAAPPPEQPEVAPPPPVRTAVWLPGFWQWGGSSWVWIAGSWQLRPEPRVTWRAPEWRARGPVHVLIPGGWVHLGGGR